MTAGLTTRWWWVRHAPVVDAHLMRLSGQSDVAADVSDTNAFKGLGAHLPLNAVWVTTQLQRTAQTAEALWQAGAQRVEPLIEPAFAEQAFGEWTGLTWAELGERPEAEAFWADPAHVAPPGAGGESFADVCARVAGRVAEMTDFYAGRDIVCVAHAGSIRAAVALALGLTPAQALGLDVKNIGLTRLDHISAGLRTKRGGNWRVVGLNQIC
ncbi:MAG TPA: histidine phosphatase family protein [Magnetovibrio sp.]